MELKTWRYFFRWREYRCVRRRHTDDAVNQTSEQQKQKQTRRLPCWLHANEAVPAERRSLLNFCWETNIHVITWSRCGVTDRHPKHALQHAGGILGRDWSTWADRYEPRDASRPHRADALTLHVAEVSSCKYLVLSVSEAAAGVCVRAHTLKPPGQL